MSKLISRVFGIFSRRFHALIEPKSQSMYLLSAETEVWELETGNNKIISPTLPDGKYLSEIGIYAVDFNFCSK